MGNAPGFWYLLQPLFHQSKGHGIALRCGSARQLSLCVVEKKNKFAAKDGLKRIVVDTSVGFLLIHHMIFIGP